MSDRQERLYHRDDVVTFRRTSEPFGGLSNMAPGFPILVGSVRAKTAEALYQACRFPHRPDLQEAILAENSPMTAKMRAKPHRDESRGDWGVARVRIMKWCLRAKLACNAITFGSLLLSTGARPIVEDSRRDAYWGAIPGPNDTLVGENVLGRLLMDIRARLQVDPQGCHLVRPLPLPDFRLLGRPIGVIDTLTEHRAALSLDGRLALS
jgi:ribA/ribD-fused uncharacterized protein